MLTIDLTNNLAKNLRSLQTKKARQTAGLFLVEGLKPVVELLQSDWEITSLCATAEFFVQQEALIVAAQKRQQQASKQPIQLVKANPQQLARLGSLVTNNAAVAVVKQHQIAADTHQLAQDSWLLAVDGVNDPANLGSLLRIADWFGLEQVLCSPNSVEVYNPKVIAASKGSFLRVGVNYLPLAEFLPGLAAKNLPIVGAVLDGKPLAEVAAQLKTEEAKGVLVLGSEASGLSKEVEGLLTHRLTIPRLGQAESLNLGVAAGIITAHLLL